MHFRVKYTFNRNRHYTFLHPMYIKRIIILDPIR